MNSLTTTEGNQGGNPVAVLRSQLERSAEELVKVLPAHIKPDKLQRTIMTAVQASPSLLECDRRSFMQSVFKAAQDGLLPDGREAALVEFQTGFKDPQDGKWKSRRQVQYMPMVYGLRKKILQSGDVTDIFATVVFRQEIEAGLFIYEEGTERILRHKPLLDPTFDPSDDDIALAYSVATFSDGSKSFEVLLRRDINKIRQASQTGATRDRQGNAREAKGPWVDWFAEMAKKSVVRRHSKSLPMSGDIMVDVEGDDQRLAAQGAVAMLQRDSGDDPRLIDAGDGEAADAETGEILEESGNQPETAEITPEDAKAAAEVTQAALDDMADDMANPPAPPADYVVTGVTYNTMTIDDGEETEIEPLPSEKAAATRIGNEFTRAETIIDLMTAYARNEADLDALPDELREACRIAFDDREAVLRGARGKGRK